jgi:hypothetical protein
MKKIATIALVAAGTFGFAGSIAGRRLQLGRQSLPVSQPKRI